MDRRNRASRRAAGRSRCWAWLDRARVARPPPSTVTNIAQVSGRSCGQAARLTRSAVRSDIRTTGRTDATADVDIVNSDRPGSGHGVRSVAETADGFSHLGSWRGPPTPCRRPSVAPVETGWPKLTRQADRGSKVEPGTHVAGDRPADLDGKDDLDPRPPRRCRHVAALVGGYALTPRSRPARVVPTVFSSLLEVSDE